MRKQNRPSIRHIRNFIYSGVRFVEKASVFVSASKNKMTRQWTTKCIVSPMTSENKKPPDRLCE